MNSEVFTAIKRLYDFVYKECDWNDNLVDCLKRQLKLERRFFIMIVKERNPKHLLEAAKWLYQADPLCIQWFELLLRRLIDLLDPAPSLHIILSMTFYRAGYDDEAVEDLKAAEALTDDLTVTKFMIAVSHDPAIQQEYAERWKQEEPRGVASDIIQYISQTGERIPLHLINSVLNQIRFDIYKELEKLARQYE